MQQCNSPTKKVSETDLLATNGMPVFCGVVHHGGEKTASPFLARSTIRKANREVPQLFHQPCDVRSSTRRDDSDEIERTQLLKSPKKKKMSGMLGDLFEF